MLINIVQTVNISYTRQENFSKGKIPRHVQNVCITEKKKIHKQQQQQKKQFKRELYFPGIEYKERGHC